MDMQETAGNRADATARLAVLAGLPGLILIVVAATNSNSLALEADLILSLLDMLVLLTVWAVARLGRDRPSPRRRATLRRARHFACMLAAGCMLLSMCSVAWMALARIAEGGLPPTGTGLRLGIAVNVAFAAANLFILNRWRQRYREERTAFVRSQVCLFWDKLSTNVILVISLGIGLCCPEGSLGRLADPVGSLLIVASSLRWTVPVVRDALEGLRIGWCRRRRHARITAARST